MKIYLDETDMAMWDQLTGVMRGLITWDPNFTGATFTIQGDEHTWIDDADERQGARVLAAIGDLRDEANEMAREREMARTLYRISILGGVQCSNHESMAKAVEYGVKCVEAMDHPVDCSIEVNVVGPRGETGYRCVYVKATIGSEE